MRITDFLASCRAAIIVVALCAFLAPAGAQQPAATAVVAGAEAQYVYRFQARDTLIGASRRLLLQPQRWPELQRFNGIRSALVIPPGTPIRIPWSWLKLVPETALVLSVTGTVTRDGVPLAQGDVLAQGVRVDTSADGSATLQFADQSVVTLQKSSVLRLERLQRVEAVPDAHRVELRLESGRTETAVKPQRDVGRFEIVTPVAISAVRGTQFRTGFDAAATQATAETLEGTVAVGASQGSADVGAGYGTRVESAGSVLAPVPLLPAPDLAALPAINARPVLHVEVPPLPQAATYRVQLASDAQFHALRADAFSVSPAFDVPVPADGEFWLRVRGIDALGIEGRDAARAFTQHVLPGAPVAVAPAPDARFHGDGISLQWSTLAEAVRYRVQVARDAQFGDVVDDRQAEAAAMATLRDLVPGVYFWRVAGINAANESGDWSASRRFVLRPATPLVSASQRDTKLLRLTWLTLAGERYRLQVSRDAAFTRLFADTTLQSAGFEITRPASGTWFARLQLIDAQGVADPVGEAQRFDVPIRLWLKVLLGSTVLLPLLL